MTDPRFGKRLRSGLTDQFMPAWTVDAACRPYSAPGTHWEWMFTDEVAEKPAGVEYDFPDKTQQAMRVCAGCPVRTECLEDAYETEQQQSTEWWSGEPVESDRRFGIRGGLPGRMRERFAELPDRLDRSHEWFGSYARKRGWLKSVPRRETA